MSDNPFAEIRSQRNSVESAVIIIFGATGDLTHRKLIPALYNLAAEGDLPETRIIGFARRQKTDQQYRDELETSNRRFSRQEHSQLHWQDFAANITYHTSEFEDDNGYTELKKKLDELEKNHDLGNRLFYLAVSPDYFAPILRHLKNCNLNTPIDNAWTRVIVEKPFGTDLATAQELNTVVADAFHEHDTFRIDHFLGKETAQNIMVMRFANSIFHPLWNARFIESVQITCAENIGMEGGRGAFYDTAGALRDMVQNHLLQLISLVAMDPPTDLSADSIRDEKVKVLRALRPITGSEAVGKNVIRAQYTAGAVDGLQKPGYRQEDRVAPDSQTESYVAMCIHVDTWRWSGVPFYLRVGKQLPKKSTEISIHFKYPPAVLFNTDEARARQNILIIRIQPDEGTSLRMSSKVPGSALRIEPVKMDFQYSSSFGKSSPEAYERLLLDALAGDATLFARRDEVENAWRFIDPIEAAWHDSDPPPPHAPLPRRLLGAESRRRTS